MHSIKKMNKSWLIIFLLVATTIGHQATASAEKVKAANHVLKGSHKYTATVALYGDHSIKVFEFDNKYYYTPVPTVDWPRFKQDVSSNCSGRSDEEMAFVRLQVRHYSKQTKTAIAQAGKISLSQLTEVPVYAWSFFAKGYTGNETVLGIEPSTSTLFLGESLESSVNIPPRSTLSLQKSCGFLREIADVESLVVAYHAVGQKFKKSKLTAGVVLKNSSSDLFDVDMDSSEVQETSISVSGGASGFALDMGPIRFGNAKSKSTTTSSTTNTRFISRSWLAKRSANLVRGLKIEQICDQSESCGDTTLINLVVDFVKQHATEQTLTLQDMGNQTFKMLLNEVDVNSAKITIDETVKGELDLLYDAATNEGGKVSAGGVEAERDRDAANKLHVKNIGSFERKGEDWVPTSLKVLMVNKQQLSEKIETSYSQIVLNGDDPVAFVATQANVDGLKAGDIEAGRYGTLQDLTEEINTLTDWNREWKAHDDLRQEQINSLKEISIVMGDEPHKIGKNLPAPWKTPVRAVFCTNKSGLYKHAKKVAPKGYVLHRLTYAGGHGGGACGWSFFIAQYIPDYNRLMKKYGL